VITKKGLLCEGLFFNEKGVLKVNIVLFFFTLMSLSTFAVESSSLVEWSDRGYAQRVQGRYRWIYSEKKSPTALEDWSKMSVWLQTIDQTYQNKFKSKPFFKTDLIIASKNQQVANAFATTVPNNLLMFYSGGGSLVEEFATPYWMRSLLVHEIAHLYQLSPMEGFSKFYTSIFGVSPFAPIIIIPFFPQPSLTLPTWLLEGHAVWLESQWSQGGRLFSGESWALFLTLLKERTLDGKFLTNDRLLFPYGDDKYIVGGFFYWWLSRKIGEEKVNEFFQNISKHYINPFSLDHFYRRYLGIGYHQAIREFLDFYRPLANDFEQAKQKEKESVALCPFSGGLNRQNETISFVCHDGKKYPSIYLFKTTGEALGVREELNIPLGKMFSVGDKEWGVQGNRRNEKWQTRMGLWKENSEALPDFDGKEVIDWQGDRYISLEGDNSFFTPQYHLSSGDQKSVTSCTHTPRLDEKGNIYCFRQEEKERILLKNGEEFYRFSGHWSLLTDISEEKIYFIGVGPRGTRLYRLDENKTLTEWKDHDGLIEMRKGQGDLFWLGELTSQGKHYFKITLNEEDWQFIDQPRMIQSPAKEQLALPTGAKQEDSLEEEKGYYSFFNMRYGSTQYQLGVSDAATSVSFESRFLDPLGRSALHLFFTQDKNKTGLIRSEKTGGFSYKNTPSFWSWGLRMLVEDKEVAGASFLGDVEITPSFLLPLRRDKDHELYFSARYESHSRLEGEESALGLLGGEILRNVRLAIFPHFSMKWAIGREEFTKTDGYLWHGRLKMVKQLFSRVNIHGEVKAMKGDKRLYEWDVWEREFPDKVYTYFNRAGLFVDQETVMLSSTHDLEILSDKLIVGLRRVSPFILFRRFDVHAVDPFYEYGGGLDLEMLLAHRFPVRFDLTFLRHEIFGDQTIFRLNQSF
jgi:hypothetical protein